VARAETGPALAFAPAGRGPARSLAADVQVYLDGRTDADADFDLTILRFEGKAAVGTRFTVGVEVERLFVDTADGRLPGDLTDTSVAVGVRLGDTAGWRFAGTLGVGFAGDQPFGDAAGWYGLGSLGATKELDRGTTLTVLLQYDGNRGFLPDWPLIGVVYRKFVHPGLRFAVGLPFSSVYWKPGARWEVEAAGIPLVRGRVSVAFLPADGWRVFLRWRARTSYFHLDGTAHRFRLRYEEQAVELGVTWGAERGPSVTFLGGWGFRREFENESDSGREFGAIDISDEPYLMLRATFAF
jgi:hypothetical protein